MNKKILPLVIILASIVVIILIVVVAVPVDAQGIDQSSEELISLEQKSLPPVKVLEAKPTDFYQYGEYLGEAIGIAEIALSSPGGRVFDIKANEGQLVTEGESLGTIDPENANINYQLAQLDERLAKDAYNRELSFLNQGTVSQLQVDQKKMAWLQSQSTLLQAKNFYESAYSISPIDGVVLSRSIEVHQETENGDPTFRIGDLSTMRISVGIPESDMSQADFWVNGEFIENAPITKVHFPAIGEEVWEATIERAALTRSRNSLSYDVHVLVDNPNNRIRSGQTANVQIPLRSYNDVIVVPTSSIFTRNRDSMVMLIKDGIVKDQIVELGPSANSSTVILSGLEPGDQIVEAGMNRLSDGDAVNIVGISEWSFN